MPAQLEVEADHDPELGKHHAAQDELVRQREVLGPVFVRLDLELEPAARLQELHRSKVVSM